MAIIGGAREVISGLSTSKGLGTTTLIPTSGAATSKKIYKAAIQPQTHAVYVAWDGAAADNTGLLLQPGDILWLEGYHVLKDFRAIEETASATLLVMPSYLV